jgi:hypothetical protein
VNLRKDHYRTTGGAEVVADPLGRARLEHSYSSSTSPLVHPRVGFSFERGRRLFTNTKQFRMFFAFICS